MHYHAEVWLPDHTEDIKDFIDTLLSPYNEQNSRSKKTFYDWYEIGGRWTGVHTNYNPDSDPLNWSTCSLCRGTGQRPDLDPPSWRQQCRGCNSCHGTGISRNYGNVRYEKDILPLSEVTNTLKSYTLIIAQSKRPLILHEEVWDGKTFVKTEYTGLVKDTLKAHGITTGILVTVDYHC